MDDLLLEPLKAYKSTYKEAVHNEAIEFFKGAVEKSGINIEKNRETIKKLNAKTDERTAISKTLNGLKVLRIFLIIFTVLAFATTIGSFVYMFMQEEYKFTIIFAVLGIVLGIGLSLLIGLVLNPKIKTITGEYNSVSAECERLLQEANAQMAPLNRIYDWNLATMIIEKVIPMLDFDKFFDGEKYIKLCKNYGLNDIDDNDHSTIFVQSGNILGNPFLMQKQKVSKIVNKAYTGMITITWTEYYTDSDGHRQSRTRTENLTATTYHPAPVYTNETALIYGNQAAPTLCFSRGPQGLDGKNEKQIDKYVESKVDDLDKMAEKSLSRGDKHVFTPLTNTEFEVLFHALDRNDETQFRLLFTPLAQKNQTDFIKSKEGFGDDFYFYKQKMINVISSRHSQNFDYSGNPRSLYSYDYDHASKLFVDYVDSFFKHIYFDFIPLLNIPLYQQMKSIDYIYGEDTPANFSTYEHEVMANSFGENMFKHPDSATTCILKSHLVSKQGKADKVEVTAYSYRGTPQIDYVDKMGGDGRLHTIPVHWIEYTPLTRNSLMEIRDTNTSRFDFNNKLKDNELKEFIKTYSREATYSFQRGLVALLVDEAYSSENDSELESIFERLDKADDAEQ